MNERFVFTVRRLTFFGARETLPWLPARSQSEDQMAEWERRSRSTESSLELRLLTRRHATERKSSLRQKRAPVYISGDEAASAAATKPKAQAKDDEEVF